MLWTGKQILSIIMKPSKKCLVKANLRCKGKSYTRDEEFCFRDSCKLYLDFKKV
jgi:DNA-directed RNA polymerase III subunit RPC1